MNFSIHRNDVIFSAGVLSVASKLQCHAGVTFQNNCSYNGKFVIEHVAAFPPSDSRLRPMDKGNYTD